MLLLAVQGFFYAFFTQLTMEDNSNVDMGQVAQLASSSSEGTRVLFTENHDMVSDQAVCVCVCCHSRELTPLVTLGRASVCMNRLPTRTMAAFLTLWTLEEVPATRLSGLSRSPCLEWVSLPRHLASPCCCKARCGR